MDELHKRANGYIQMKEMYKFRNEVRQARQKRDKWEANTKIDLHKRHNPDKRYTPLTVNHTTILEETFNLEVPIKLPLTEPPKSGFDATKYCRYHHSIGHDIED